jgi:hypothetical protein
MRRNSLTLKREFMVVLVVRALVLVAVLHLHGPKPNDNILH